MPRWSGRRHRDADEVRELVAEFRESGLSRAAFALRVGVHPNTVTNWLRREADDGESHRIVPVRVKVATADPTGEIEIILRSGIRIGVRRGFDRDVLLDVLSALEPSC
jgi:transposase-like protein